MQISERDVGKRQRDGQTGFCIKAGSFQSSRNLRLLRSSQSSTGQDYSSRMFRALALTAFTLLAVSHAQQVGTNTAETHPALSVQECSAGGSCTTQQRSIVLDSNWRWVHSTEGYTNCYTGNTWDTSLCPDPTTCASVSTSVDSEVYTR
jgi:hypothetical protein